MDDKSLRYMLAWRKDWARFARDVLKSRLDSEQEDILHSVQTNPKTTVASGTARGKDYVSAVACMCFLYLTPRFNSEGVLIKNTKVAMTAPTGRQVQNIMMPEIQRLFYRASGCLPGRVTSQYISTGYSEWFLTGFRPETTIWRHGLDSTP